MRIDPFMFESVGSGIGREFTQHPLLGRIATHKTGKSYQHLYDSHQNGIATLDNVAAFREITKFDDFGFPTKTSCERDIHASSFTGPWRGATSQICGNAIE